MKVTVLGGDKVQDMVMCVVTGEEINLVGIEEMGKGKGEGDNWDPIPMVLSEGRKVCWRSEYNPRRDVRPQIEASVKY